MSYLRESIYNEDDAQDETPILDDPELSRDLVNKIRSCESLKDLLQYLVGEKPGELKFGSEHYLDLRRIEEQLSGLCLKFKIHGYDDRGERLHYLFSILSKKLAKKEETLKIIVQFLMISSQRPTAVTRLELKSNEYSPDPDDEDSVDEDSLKQKALLMKILSENDGQDDVVTGMSYSSDSELSEWSTDEESIEEKSNNDLPPIVKIRHSSSFGEFSDIAAPKEDAEALRKEAHLYWTEQKLASETFLYKEIRKFETFRLRNQPVISSLLVLQSRFGEFWEWKKHAKEKTELFVAFEEDVLREVLWQFSISSPQSSPVFTTQWNVKPTIMVATLSRSCFANLMNKFGKVLFKLESLRKFSSRVEDLSTKDDPKFPISKVFRNYAAGLTDISRYIISVISKLEQDLNKTCRRVGDKKDLPCSTLIQLERKTASLCSIINILYDIHSKSVSPFNEADGETEEPWLSALKLISCLETNLLLQTNPVLYGVLLFIYCKCLQAFLDDTIYTLRTMKWDEKYSLFVRDTSVRLNDSNFWSDCIQIRDYKTILRECKISPLVCLDKFLPKVLNILKTCEVLDQLEEDFTQVLSKSNVIVEDLISEFVEENFSMSYSPKKSQENDLIRKSQPQDEVDFEEHFAFIGLESSLAATAFRFLTSDTCSPKSTKKKKDRRFEDFLQFSTVPIRAHTETLEMVLEKWFSPFATCAKESIQKIFQDYRVLESMRVFQEIILTVREDFAKAIIDIVSNHKRSEVFTYEDSLNRNPKFQKLLNDCYPEGREIFSVDLKLDTTTDMKYTLITTPHFPLNLIVTPQSVAGYLFIGRQLHRIRKSLWDLCILQMQDCVASEEVNVTRLLMFRFCLINFCSSLRSFFTLKLFSTDFSDFAKSASYENDLDSIRRIHEDYLESIKTHMLRNPLIENIIIRKVVVMSDVLRKRWSVGMPQTTMLMLEDTLKKCWHVVNDFESTKYSSDFNDLSYYFGPPPTCL